MGGKSEIADLYFLMKYIFDSPFYKEIDDLINTSIPERDFERVTGKTTFDNMIFLGNFEPFWYILAKAAKARQKSVFLMTGK